MLNIYRNPTRPSLYSKWGGYDKIGPRGPKIGHLRVWLFCWKGFAGFGSAGPTTVTCPEALVWSSAGEKRVLLPDPPDKPQSADGLVKKTFGMAIWITVLWWLTLLGAPTLYCTLTWEHEHSIRVQSTHEHQWALTICNTEGSMWWRNIETTRIREYVGFLHFLWCSWIQVHRCWNLTIPETGHATTTFHTPNNSISQDVGFANLGQASLPMEHARTWSDAQSHLGSETCRLGLPQIESKYCHLTLT